MKAISPLRQERECRGWSQAKVAELLDTSTVSVSQWERGLFTPSPHFRELLCKLFEKDAVELGFVALPLQTKKPLLDPAIPFLGSPPSGLIGRDTLLPFLIHRLMETESSSNAIVLHGLPGVGKTALALALVEHQTIQSVFSGGILWAGLGPQVRITEHLSRWSLLLGWSNADIEQMKSIDEWSNRLRYVIGERRFLIVLDDVWEREDARILQIGGPQSQHIITTRTASLEEKVVVDDEMILVPPLSEEDGVSLLTHFIPSIIEHELELVRLLVNQVGGLPLALSLMGKYLQAQAYTEHPRRVQHALSSLQQVGSRLQLQTPRAPLDAHPALPIALPVSLDAVIAVSEQHLSPSAQEGLRALAVLPAMPASFLRETALAMLEQSLAVLEELREAGLIEFIHDYQRYQLHQTIADYARQRIEGDAPYLKLIQHSLDYLHVHITDFDRIEQENELIAKALETAYSLKQYRSLIKTCNLLLPFFQARGLYSVATRYFLWAYEAASIENDYEARLQFLLRLGIANEKIGASEKAEKFLADGLQLAHQLQSRTQIQFLQSLGDIRKSHGQYSQAQAFFQDAHALASQWEEHEYSLSLYISLAWLALNQDNAPLANIYAQKGFELVHHVHTPLVQGQFFYLIGTLYIEQGEYEVAKDHLIEGLFYADTAQNNDLIGSLFRHLGIVAGRQGDYFQAETVYNKALVIARHIGNRRLASLLLNNLGLIAYLQGKDQVAEENLQEALNIGYFLKHNELIISSLINLGNLAYEKKSFIEAVERYNDALNVVQHANSTEYFRCLILCGLIRTMIEKKEFNQIASYLQECREAAKKADTTELKCEVLLVEGEYALQAQNIAKATEAFQQLLEQVPKGEIVLSTQAYYGLARVAELRGQLEEAQELGQMVLEQWTRLGYRDRNAVEIWLQEVMSLITKREETHSDRYASNQAGA